VNILLAHKLTYFPAWNGAGKADRALLEGLAARGHSCRLLTLASAMPSPKMRSKFLKELAIRGIQVSSLTATDCAFLHNGVEVHAVSTAQQLSMHLADQIRRFEPTWTLISEDPTHLCLSAALEASPSRVIYLAHSQATLPFGPECFAPDPNKTDLLQRVAGTIAVSEHVKNYLRRWAGLESVVIPGASYGTGPFRRLGSFDKGFVVMVNPSAIKGMSIFLELARTLPAVQFAAVPTWATTSADRRALERMQNIQLLKPVDDIDELFAVTRILVVPSLWGEAFGHIVVEAMLRGIPVLASNVGGLPEAKLGVDYVVPVRPIERYLATRDEMHLPVPEVPEQDVDPWLVALQKLLSDREHYDRVSNDSRKAALVYVARHGVSGFEEYLEGLRPAPVTEAHSAITGQSDQRNQMTLDTTLPEDLSPERLELLALLLREKH
jgi:glycosyltransferase involved in cell wall biosynthesis